MILGRWVNNGIEGKCQSMEMWGWKLAANRADIRWNDGWWSIYGLLIHHFTIFDLVEAKLTAVNADIKKVSSKTHLNYA